jgi:hypothetical protein
MNGHRDALTNATFLNVSDVRRLLRDLSIDEKVALIAEALDELPADRAVRFSILPTSSAAIV